LGKAELLAIDFGDPGGEIEGVDGLLRRVVEKVRDVQNSLFVLEGSFLAVKGEVPDSEAAPEGIGRTGWWRIGVMEWGGERRLERWSVGAWKRLDPDWWIAGFLDCFRE